MKVLITGGFGFIGRKLCERILAYGELVGSDEQSHPVREIVLFDMAAPPADLPGDPRVKAVSGDITDASTCKELVDEDGMIVFHLVSVMSGQGEKDFDLCWRVNLESTKSLLDACRARTGCKFIFPSSGACFGDRPDGPETDSTKLLPHTSYGMTKVCIELLINDYSRRGFVDGRTARLPTVIPRPTVNSGLPAAFSAVIREPLKGQDVALTIKPDMPHAVCGFRPLVRNLVHLAQLPQVVFSGSVDRALNMPALSVTLKELHDAMVSVVRDPSKLGRVTYEVNEEETAKLSTFHRDMDATRARALGFMGDSTAADIVTDFAAEYVDAALLKPILEIHEEAHHNLMFSNEWVKVFRTEFPAGESTLWHVHRVTSLYFFLSGTTVINIKQGEEPVEDTLQEGEVRYGDHCDCPLVHQITCRGPKPMFCLDVELTAYARSLTKNGVEPSSKSRKTGTVEPPHGLVLTKERPAARVYDLKISAGSSWKHVMPFSKMLFVVKCGAHVRGTFGDRRLLPAEVLFHEGPMELCLHVQGAQEMFLWVVELL